MFTRSSRHLTSALSGQPLTFALRGPPTLRQKSQQIVIVAASSLPPSLSFSFLFGRQSRSREGREREKREAAERREWKPWRRRALRCPLPLLPPPALESASACPSSGVSRCLSPQDAFFRRGCQLYSGHGLEMGAASVGRIASPIDTASAVKSRQASMPSSCMRPILQSWMSPELFPSCN